MLLGKSYKTQVMNWNIRDKDQNKQIQKYPITQIWMQIPLTLEISALIQKLPLQEKVGTVESMSMLMIRECPRC